MVGCDVLFVLLMVEIFVLLFVGDVMIMVDWVDGDNGVIIVVVYGVGMGKDYLFFIGFVDVLNDEGFLMFCFNFFYVE